MDTIVDQKLRECYKGMPLYCPLLALPDGRRKWNCIFIGMHRAKEHVAIVSTSNQYKNNNYKMEVEIPTSCLFPNKDVGNWDGFIKIRPGEKVIFCPARNNEINSNPWLFGIYQGAHTCGNLTPNGPGALYEDCQYIIRYEDFDPKDIQGSMKKSI